jgi:hypothetical protein
MYVKTKVTVGSEPSHDPSGQLIEEAKDRQKK